MTGRPSGLWKVYAVQYGLVGAGIGILILVTFDIPMTFSEVVGIGACMVFLFIAGMLCGMTATLEDERRRGDYE